LTWKPALAVAWVSLAEDKATKAGWNRGITTLSLGNYEKGSAIENNAAKNMACRPQSGG